MSSLSFLYKDDIRISLAEVGLMLGENGHIRWSSLATFSAELGLFRAWCNKHLSYNKPCNKVEYLAAQQDMIDSNASCELLLDGSRLGPFIHCELRQGSIAVMARAFFSHGKLNGVLRRDDTSEALRVDTPFIADTVAQLTNLMRAELTEPSLNFCTVYGDHFS